MSLGKASIVVPALAVAIAAANGAAGAQSGPGVGAREPLTHNHSGIYGWWQPYFWEGPFDFGIVQAFVLSHESLDEVQNAADHPGLWNENLGKARAAGKRIIAQATPGQGALKTEEYYQGLVTFLENVDRDELYAVTLSEENIFWNGEHERLTRHYRRLKKRFPDLPVFQWYSNSSRGTAWPGFLYPWLPADGWIIDEYYAEPRDFEQEVRRYRMLGLPLIQLGYAAPVEAAKHPISAYHPSLLQGQLRVARKYNVPFAYYCWEGGMPKRTFAWAETAEEASRKALSLVLDEAQKAREVPLEDMLDWDDARKPVKTVLREDGEGTLSYREDYDLRMTPKDTAPEHDFMARSLTRGLRHMRWTPQPSRIVVKSDGRGPVDASITNHWTTPNGERCRFSASANVTIEAEASVELIFEVSTNGYDWIKRTAKVVDGVAQVDVPTGDTGLYTRLRIAGGTAKAGEPLAAIDWIEVRGNTVK